jgi:SAM-dependent methyltransferase
MDLAEDSHWWYFGLQDLLRRLLRSPLCRLPERPVVLDIGCGTGANLRVLADCLRPEYLGGFDLRADCVARARQKCPSAEVYESDVRRPTFRRAKYDLIVCCDVISDVGLDAGLEGLREATARLAPGGVFLTHVPACPWLRSEHDEAVGTVQRFRQNDLRRLYRGLGLQLDFIGYRMSISFGLLAGLRLCRVWRHASTPQSDLRRSSFFPTSWRWMIIAENTAICRKLKLPIGGSLLALGRCSG